MHSLLLSTFLLASWTLAQPVSRETQPSTPAQATDPAPHESDHDPEEDARLNPGRIEFDPSIPASIETKRLKPGLLLVRPKVNGHAAGWFIFDTGAGICVISTPKTQSLHLAPDGKIEGAGVGGSSMMSLFRADTLSLGRVTLHDCRLMQTDLSFLKQYLGEEIEGIIGYDMLARCVVEIEVGAAESNPRIEMHDPKGYSLAKGSWQELQVKGRIPCVAARFEDHDGLFRLDCGADGFVTIHEPSVRKWDLLKDRDVKDAKLGGVGGVVAAKSGTLAWFELAGVRRENIPAKFAIEAKGNFADENKDGNIGAELLRPFRVVLDYSGHRVAFVPRDGKEVTR
jgi:hypothetical protein